VTSLIICCVCSIIFSFIDLSEIFSVTLFVVFISFVITSVFCGSGVLTIVFLSGLFNSTFSFRDKYMPLQESYTGQTVGNVFDCIVRHNVNNKLSYYRINNNDINDLTKLASHDVLHCTDFFNIGYDKPVLAIKNTPNIEIYSIYNTLNSQHFKTAQNSIEGNWNFVTTLNCNYMNPNSTRFNYYDRRLLARNENGYFYFFSKYDRPYVYKLCRGTFATAYLQENGLINAYICDGRDTQKYIITINSNFTASIVKDKTYANTLVVYELYDGKALMETITGWSVGNL